MNSLKMQKTMMLEDEPPRSVGDNMLTWEEQRNSPRKNEDTEPKQKWCQVVDIYGGESKFQCCKEHQNLES